MAICTQALVDAALVKVATSIPELAVELYPANPTTFRLNHPTGALLLAYPGSTSGDQVSLCSSDQIRKVRLGWTLVVRQLWGPDGAPSLLDRLRATMTGWAPEGQRPVQAVSERLLQEDSGLWWYVAEYSYEMWP